MPWTPLHDAVLRGSLEDVKRIVHQVKDAIRNRSSSSSSSSSSSGVMVVVDGYEVVVMEEEDNDDDDVMDKHNQPSLLRTFLETKEASNGYTALFLACIHGHVDVVRYLVLEGGADVAIKDKNGASILHHLASSNVNDSSGSSRSRSRGDTTITNQQQQQQQVGRFLVLECGANVNVQLEEREGWMPIHIACQHAALPKIQWLVEELGALVPGRKNSRYENNICPLDMILNREKDELVDNQFDPTSSSEDEYDEDDDDDVTAVDGCNSKPHRLRRAMAIKDRIESCIRILLRANPDIDSTTTAQKLWYRPPCVNGWETRMYFVACYNERFFGISHETTQRFPIHALLQTEPLVRRPVSSDHEEVDEEGEGEEPTRSDNSSNKCDLWGAVFHHFGPSSCLSLSRDFRTASVSTGSTIVISDEQERYNGGLIPLELYFHRFLEQQWKLSSSSVGVLSMNWDMIRSLLDVQPRAAFFTLPTISKPLDGSNRRQEQQQQQQQIHPAILMKSSALSSGAKIQRLVIDLIYRMIRVDPKWSIMILSQSPHTTTLSGQ